MDSIDGDGNIRGWAVYWSELVFWLLRDNADARVLPEKPLMMDTGGRVVPTDLFQRLAENNLLPTPLMYHLEPFTRRQADSRPGLPAATSTRCCCCLPRGWTPPARLSCSPG
eukprot:6018879-Alexandrium_andersonii.AAC.1